MQKTGLLARLAAALVACLAASAAEPCGPGLLWGPGQSPNDQANNGPRGFTRWDPDGDGPQREWLVFCGQSFSSLSFPPVNYGSVYGWDGGQYQALGPGDSMLPWEVTGVGNWNGTLVAAGVVSASSHVVAWDGTRWNPVATNLKAGVVTDFLTYKGELLITGYSSIYRQLRLTDGRVSSVMVLRNGAWEPLGPEQPGFGLDLIEFEGDVIVGGGSFWSSPSSPDRPMASRWNGTEWIPMDAAGWSGTSLCRLEVFHGRLVAVGQVTLPPSTVPATALVWNGTAWEHLGVEQGSEAWNVAVHDDALWVTLGSGLYRWDRRAWTKYLPPDVSSMWFGSFSMKLYSFYPPLLSWDGDLLVSGATVVSEVNDTVGGAGTLRVTNGRLQTLASGLTSLFSASAGCSYGGRLFIGGQLRRAGFERSSGIAAWDGVNWDGNYKVSVPQNVYGFAVHSTGLWAYGLIKQVPGPANTSLPAWGIVRWDGSQWSAFGDATNVPSDGTIRALLVDDDGMFAARLDSVGPTTSTVRRWTGSGWEQLGGTANGQISRLIRYNGKILACGTFTQWDGNAVGRVAEWNGTQWVGLGGGMNKWVRDLAVHQGDLYACGSFDTADNQPALGVARWSGQAWESVGSGPASGSWMCLRSYRGELFAGGSRTVAGPSGTSQYAALERWNGTSWSTFDLGPLESSSIVNGLTEHSGELVIVGAFRKGGAGFFESLRRWSGDKNPWIAWQPQNADADCGGSATFRARVANGYDISSSVWYRGADPVIPNPAAGVRVEFAGGQSVLRLDNVDASLAGAYRCVFTHPCGTLESAPTALAVTGICCPGDLTLDAIVDDADFLGFAAAYDVMDCSAATMLAGCAADLNNDGLVDDGDFGVFVGAYRAMACP